MLMFAHVQFSDAPLVHLNAQLSFEQSAAFEDSALMARFSSTPANCKPCPSHQ